MKDDGKNPVPLHDHHTVGRQPNPSRRRCLEDDIDLANAKSVADFIHDYIQPNEQWRLWTHPTTHKQYNIKMVKSSDLTSQEKDDCFKLVEETSGKDYRNSSIGWHEAAKREEMESQNLWYLLIQDEAERLHGFSSFMPTIENREPVVYCYEIHLKHDLRGTGRGKYIMQCLEKIAENISTVEKVMLTCFTSNTNAMEFYQTLGFVKDDHSPSGRKLKGGKEIFIPDYVLLSKRVKTHSKHKQAKKT